MSRVILITGGGRGIGAATARLAADEGYDVCIGYRSDEAAATAVTADIESRDGRCLPVQVDISDESQVGELFNACESAFGPADAFVNNAGILDRQSRLADMSAERMRRVFEVNITGAFLCAREAVRRMGVSGGGRGGAIVNVSSRAAVLGAPDEYVDYAASKGAMDTLTVGLAKEVARDGIRVNAVRPGLIYTDIHASGGEPGRVDRLASRIPLGRGGEADEVARAILWLASDRASFCTGTFIDVSGGT